MPASKPLTVALLVVPEVSASTLYGLYDTLRSAGRHWQLMHGDAEPEPPFRPLVVSRDGRPVQLESGPLVKPDASLADALSIPLEGIRAALEAAAVAVPLASVITSGFQKAVERKSLRTCTSTPPCP